MIIIYILHIHLYQNSSKLLKFNNKPHILSFRYFSIRSNQQRQRFQHITKYTKIIMSQQNITNDNQLINNRQHSNTMSRNQSQARVFGISVIVIQIAFGFIYEIFVDYSSISGNDRYLIVILGTLLALLGFGSLLVYVKSSSAQSVVHVLIIMAFSFQMYFPMTGMWELIRVSGSAYNNAQNTQTLLPISVINNQNDRQVSIDLHQSSLFSWIPCFISLIVAYSGVLGRISYLQVLLLAIFGTVGYTVNEQLFWRFWITDCGGGMRIFLYGGILGLIMGLLLGQRQSVRSNVRFSSRKHFQTFAFLGSIVIWILLPVLNWVDLFHSLSSGSTGNDGFILHTVSLYMWLALCGSTIGSYSFSLLKYKKLDIHDLTHSIFTGGIAYSAMSDLYFNPGVAIGIGTITGVLCTFLTFLKWRMNLEGVRDSTGVVSSFLVPGFLSGVLSAIFHGAGLRNYGSYQLNSNSALTASLSGAYQLVGISFSIAIGATIALLVSIPVKILNKRSYDDQFNSQQFVIFTNGDRQPTSSKQK